MSTPIQKELLNYICGALNAHERRMRVARILKTWFPERMLLQQVHKWPIGSYVGETVNFLIPFGKQTNHLAIGAHYDAVSDCPGANDNGAAIVQLILAAKKIADSGNEPDVTFCLWDHEEHFGSKYMGSKLFTTLSSLPKKAIVYDVTGIGDTFYVSGEDHTGLAKDLPTRRTPPSDNHNLKMAGIPTTLICALPEHEMNSPYPDSWHDMHSKGDTPDKVWNKSLLTGANIAIELVNRFGQSN